MVHLITEFSKYLMIFLFCVYTFYSYAVLKHQEESPRAKRIYRHQTVCIFLLHLDAYAVIFANTGQVKMLVFYGAQVGFILLLFLIYRIIYRRSARLIVNHMCMLMVIGFIILTRLDFSIALRQFEIAAAAAVLSVFVPILIRKMKALRRFTWFYAALGIVALGAVWAFGSVSNGAKLSFEVGGIAVQPSEFIKIVFVFFVACMLYHVRDFKQILITTVVAAVHVLILVLSTDLGAALIFFVTYIVMLYVATRNPWYSLGGLGLGVIAALAATKLFAHVRVRVAAWKDPFAIIHDGGWQVAQSLFAIGTGGWAGMGLYQGLPDSIPVPESDFVFAAISEEMGGVFALCIILVCFSCFLMTLNVAMQIKDQFYKLIALGLGTVYGFQVFLTVGGVIKCIPSTGVTLPFVSYGGSSILCTMIMFAIIQGLYILRQDEGVSDEKGKPIQKSRKKTTYREDRREKSLPKTDHEEPRAGQGSRPGAQPEKKHGRRSRFDEDDIDEIW